ncbi:MAG TPA: hypothetical protein VGC05_03675, partial [Mycobacterium sp.]
IQSQPGYRVNAAPAVAQQRDCVRSVDSGTQAGQHRGGKGITNLGQRVPPAGVVLLVRGLALIRYVSGPGAAEMPDDLNPANPR